MSQPSDREPAWHVLTDPDVERLIDPALARAAARDALLASALGALVGPPRVSAAAGDAALTFTVGGFTGGASGFRVAGRWPAGVVGGAGGGRPDQLVAVWSPQGRLRGVVIGERLAVYRTGGLGAVAVDALADPDADTLAVIGTGRMAWGQLWATAGVRPFREIRIHSTNPAHREEFAARAQAATGIPCRAVADAEAAVADAGVVLVSTTSTKPVLLADWLAPGCHVNSTGPKDGGAAEIDPAIAERARIVVTDSPEQLGAAPKPWFSGRAAEHLGTVLANPSARLTDPSARRANPSAQLTDPPAQLANPPSPPTDFPVPPTGSQGWSLYCSVGLAGSEVALADLLLERHRTALEGHGK